MVRAFVIASKTETLYLHVFGGAALDSSSSQLSSVAESGRHTSAAAAGAAEAAAFDVAALIERIRSRHAANRLCSCIEAHSVVKGGAGGSSGSPEDDGSPMDLLWLDGPASAALHSNTPGCIGREPSAVVALTNGRMYFALVCDAADCRLLAVSALKAIVGFVHRFTRVTQPEQLAASRRSSRERLALIADKVMPQGQLLYANHRFARLTEKELLAAMKPLAGGDP